MSGPIVTLLPPPCVAPSPNTHSADKILQIILLYTRVNSCTVAQYKYVENMLWWTNNMPQCNEQNHDYINLYQQGGSKKFDHLFFMVRYVAVYVGAVERMVVAQRSGLVEFSRLTAVTNPVCAHITPFFLPDNIFHSEFII